MIASVLVALVALQDSPPPYLQFGEQVDEYAVLATSVGSCSHFGYTVDADRARAIGEELLDDGVRSGIQVRMARSMIDDAIARETEDLEYLQSRVDRDDEASIEQYVDYWFVRCDNLARRWDAIEAP